MVRAALVTLLGLSMVTSASASPLMEYNDFDIGYKHTFFDEQGLDDGDGLEMGLRVSPVEPIFLELGYEYLATGISNIDIDAHQLTYGGGAYYGCDENLHFLGRVGGITEWVDPEGGSSEDEGGWYLGAEVRGRIADDVELDGAVTYIDIGNEQAWLYAVTSVIALNDRLAFLATAELNDDTDLALSAGIRVAL